MFDLEDINSTPMTAGSETDDRIGLDEEVEADPYESEKAQKYIGKDVVKEFYGEAYTGTVQKFLAKEDVGAKEDFWEIKYSDGDKEDVKEKELLSLIEAFEKKKIEVVQAEEKDVATDFVARDKRGYRIETCIIPGCNYVGRSDYMKAHKASKHGIGVVWFACDQDNCDHKAKQAQQLKKHKQFAHDIDVQWYLCDQDGCRYKAKQATAVKRHKAHVHDIDIRWHHCDQEGCNFKTKQAGHLKQHKANIHNVDVRWFRCDQYGCCYKGKRASDLKPHKRVMHDIDLI